MSQVKPTFLNQISLGNLIQILILIAGISGAWFVMDTRSKSNEAIIHQIQEHVTQMEFRLHNAELDIVRSDERYTAIIDMLSRIEGRLARIEERK